tara:strand:- start:9322 stop:11649 length:2328 start_codon:yes stop_codon:yes gene_type:complete
MPDRIKRLNIEGFRGATQPLDLVFDPGKSVVLIFGENGTGKSTIVDAIESVSMGSTTFQDDWKLGKGKRKESYIPTLGKKLTDVSIRMEFGDNTYTATLSNKGVQLCNTANRPVAKVLRRKSLQTFMDADPAQRYKEVASFLDIPQIEASEASLREAFKEAQKQFEQATSAYGQAQENLQGLWEAEGSPGLERKQTAETWGREQAQTPTEALKAGLQNLKISLRHIDSLQQKGLAKTTAEQAVGVAQQELQQAEQSVADAESGGGLGSAELVTLLQDARAYLTKSPDSLCPVCEETAIVPGDLVVRLEQRIDAMSALQKAGDNKLRAEKNLHAKQDQLSQSIENLLNAAQSIQEYFYPDESASDSDSIARMREVDADAALAKTLQIEAELVTRLEQLQADEAAQQKQLNNLSSIIQYVKTLDEKSAEAKQKESLSKRLQQAVTIVESRRKAYVEGILAEIAQEVDKLYQKIHPAEGIGDIKLKLDENQRGSLVYGVAFGGQQDIHPQPYYSESHLDTLGLCIFLALAKRNEAARTLVVLDDVLGSADQQHLQRTLAMLMEESTNFAQLVITTHYRPLRDQFRFSRQPATPVQLIELKRWDFEHGIKSAKATTYAEDLRLQLQQQEFRREAITAQAGILFESLLEFITRTYRCKVPHHAEPRFTFGELASAPNGKLKPALKVVSQDDGNSHEIPLAPFYEKLQQAIQIRNLVGCHFNQWAGELADQEVREMAELALELADTLVCQHCGSLPLSSKSGSHWECACKKTQMHPLQQPQ